MNEIDIRTAPEDFEHSSKNVFIGKDAISRHLGNKKQIRKLNMLEVQITEG